MRAETDSWHKQEKLRCDVWTHCACVLLACSTGYPHGPYKVLYVNGPAELFMDCLIQLRSFQASVPYDLSIGFSPEVLYVFIHLIIYGIHIEN
jgi:hypothetical protein